MPADLGLTMVDVVEVRWQQAGFPGNEATHLQTTKTANPFLITFENDLNQDSGTLDIYVQYHHSLVR